MNFNGKKQLIIIKYLDFTKYKGAADHLSAAAIKVCVVLWLRFSPSAQLTVRFDFEAPLTLGS